jgi:glutaredoxin
MGSWWLIWQRWLGRLPPQRPDLHILLYTRQSCKLCTVALRLLQDFQDRYGFALETCDVDTDQELVRAHGNWVPVVLINGRLRFRGHVNPVLLRRILDVKS